MKKIYVTIICMLFFAVAGRCQTQWGSWLTVYSEGGKAIQISFSYSKWGNTCYPKGGGYHFYRIKNDFDEKVGGTIIFDNTDCDGKLYTNSAPFHFDDAAIDDAMGQWFLGKNDVRNVRLRKAPDFYDRKNKPAAKENGKDGKENYTSNGTGAGNGNSRPEPEKETEKEAEEKSLYQKKLLAEKDEARQKFIRDSIAATWKERDDRVEEHNRQRTEKAAVAAGMATTVGAVMLNDNLTNERKDGKKTFFKFGTYTGALNIPVYENTVSPNLKYSSTGSHLPLYSEVELLASLYSTPHFLFQLQPFFQYGVTFIGGDNGTYMGYGGRGTIAAGGKLKLFVTGAYTARVGENTFDHDASSAELGLYTNTKAITTLSYDYYTLEYGGGILFDTNTGGAQEKEDKYIRLSALLHQPSYVTTPAKSLVGGNICWVMGGGFTLSGEYAPEYPVAGTAANNITSSDKQTYWSVKIGKIFNL